MLDDAGTRTLQRLLEDLALLLGGVGEAEAAEVALRQRTRLVISKQVVLHSDAMWASRARLRRVARDDAARDLLRATVGHFDCQQRARPEESHGHPRRVFALKDALIGAQVVRVESR